ncbi:MAG: adenosylmethionine decarboxylase [Cyanobacteria bacterium P01_F01_bin.33]
MGTHCILDLYGCPPDLLDDADFLQAAMQHAAERANVTVLKVVAHQFHPHGVTVLGLLAESHLSIHTWPESHYAAVDVFTCGESVQPDRACESLIETLQAQSHQLQTLERNVPLAAIALAETSRN